MTKEQLQSVIRAAKPEMVIGALGDMENCQAYVEGVSINEMDGYLTKFFGISAPFKGIYDNNVIFRVTMVKRAYRELTRMAWPLIPFRKKRYIRALSSIATTEWGLKMVRPEFRLFCPAVREIIRATEKVFGAEGDIKEVIHTIGTILQFSTTYRAFVQEIAGIINKEQFLKNPLIEYLRVKRVFLNRLKSDNTKIENLWRLGFLLLLAVRPVAMKLVKEIDLGQIRFDENDWYYVLRRKSYNFGGKSIDERLKEVDNIDKEKGNIILGNK